MLQTADGLCWRKQKWNWDWWFKKNLLPTPGRYDEINDACHLFGLSCLTTQSDMNENAIFHFMTNQQPWHVRAKACAEAPLNFTQFFCQNAFCYLHISSKQVKSNKEPHLQAAAELHVAAANTPTPQMQRCSAMKVVDSFLFSPVSLCSAADSPAAFSGESESGSSAHEAGSGSAHTALRSVSHVALGARCHMLLRALCCDLCFLLERRHIGTKGFYFVWKHGDMTV